ncbi:hypothetical protein RJ640_014387, partial [Escallonia rubra]
EKADCHAVCDQKGNFCMESLFCNEVWLMSPSSTTVTANNDMHSPYNGGESGFCGRRSCFYTTKEDCEQAFEICMRKEQSYMPGPGYADHLESNDLIKVARFRAIQWFIHSRRRLNLSMGTVFSAANYFDRFISANQCHGWKYWMVELLSVACLSIASKFGETAPPPLNETQMEGLDHEFQSSLIQQMELTVLKNLEWRLGCITSSSYVEVLTWNIEFLIKPLSLEDLTVRLTELLLRALLDYKLLAFRPSVVALSALSCLLEENFPSTTGACLAQLTSLISEEQMENISKCKKTMNEKLVDQLQNLAAPLHSFSYPSSPVTVLTRDQTEMCDDQVDFITLFRPRVPCSNINLKLAGRKRAAEEG